jgi:hypothetical protein
MESLDLEEFESAAASMSGSVAARWLLCGLIGVATALTALCINMAVERVAGIKFLTTSALMLSHGHAASFFFFLTMNVSLAAAASAVTVLFAPAAAGSGIGDVKAFLNGVDVPGLLWGSTLAVRPAQRPRPPRFCHLRRVVRRGCRLSRARWRPPVCFGGACDALAPRAHLALLCRQRRMRGDAARRHALVRRRPRRRASLRRLLGHWRAL